MKYLKSQRTTSNARPIASVLAALIVSAASCAAFAAPDYGKCEVSGQRGSVKLETAVPGALSVRPVLPSPGWWNGDSIDTIKDGFEYCMAANMAYRAGLDRVVVVNRSFAQIEFLFGCFAFADIVGDREMQCRPIRIQERCRSRC